MISSRFKDPKTGKTLVFLTNNFALPAATLCALYKSRWQVELFFKWIKQHLRIRKILRQLGECGEVANMDCDIGLCPRCNRQKATQSRRLALHFITDIVGHLVREDALAASVYWRRLQSVGRGAEQSIESILILTGQ